MGYQGALTITDASQIVSLDKISEMQNQAAAWQGLAYLFNSQLSRLEAATKALTQGWSSAAGVAFAAQIGRIQTTLAEGRDNAVTNSAAWTRVASKAAAVREEIYRIEGEYNAAVGKAQDAYAKKKSEFDNNWLNNPVTNALDLVDEPDAPDPLKIREKYDIRAREVLNDASTVYSEEYFALQLPPPYDGPAASRDPIDNGNSDGARDGNAGLLGAVGLTSITGIAATWTDVFPTGPTLAGSAPPLPAPPAPVGPLLPTVPGPGPLPVGPAGPPTSLFPPKLPIKSGPAPRVPSVRSPLLPEPVEPGRSVIGSRPVTENGAARGRISNEPVIGSQRTSPSAGRSGDAGGKPAVRPSEGKPVIGRETPAAGRGRGALRAGVGADGVVRPGGRGEQPPARSGTGGQRGTRRRDDQDLPADVVEGTELWDVADGVPAVVEPPTVYDATRERPGPRIGRTDRRRA